MKQAFEPRHLANTVRMLRTQFYGAILFVEGASDKKVFSQFTILSTCRVMVANGKSNVITTVAELRSAVGVLGIIDADFEHHSNSLPSLDNIVVTDLHDLECVMCASPAFDKLINEYGEEERVSSFRQKNGENLNEVFANRTATIGFLRWISISESLELDFDGLTYAHFIGRDDLKVDVNKLVIEVLNRSQKHHLDKTQIAAKIKQESEKPFVAWQVCCGHDMLELLEFALQKTLAARKASDVRSEVLEGALRLSYEPAFFVTTTLYQDVLIWQSKQTTQYGVFEKLKG